MMLLDQSRLVTHKGFPALFNYFIDCSTMYSFSFQNQKVYPPLIFRLSAGTAVNHAPMYISTRTRAKSQTNPLECFSFDTPITTGK